MSIDSIIIFAGGKSSRMGRDKSLLPFGGYNSMAEYQYRRLGQIFARAYISAKSDKFDFDADIIADTHSSSSPMVALVSVLESLDDEAVFVLSVDMPLLDEEIISEMIHRYQTLSPTPDILIAQSPRGREPLCGIYSQRVLPIAKQLLESDIHKMHRLFGKLHVEIASFKQSEKFANLNTIEEYEAVV